MKINQIFQVLLIVIFTFFTVSCSTLNPEPVKILHVEKIKDTTYLPDEVTAVEVGVSAGIGYGIGLLASPGISAGGLALYTLGGATIALFAHYLYAGTGVYQYEIEKNNKTKMTVTQYNRTPLTKGATVNLILVQDRYELKRQ